MIKKGFYLDSCIWLNLLKKEGNPKKGKPYWKITKDFIKHILISSDSEIFYSGCILKEIKFKIDPKKYEYFRSSLKNMGRFIKFGNSDYSFARKIESEFDFKISFFDCLHIAICKREYLILVTRDKELMKYADRYITAEKPENLFS